MSENLPVNVETPNDGGTICYANEVIAIIAGMAVSEVDGVSTVASSNSLSDLFGRTKTGKPITRGIKVEITAQEASVDVTLTVEYGKPIQAVCEDVQENVRKGIETMTGLRVSRVDVHVVGVSFEREAKQLAEGAKTVSPDVEEADEAPVIKVSRKKKGKPAEEAVAIVDETPAEEVATETPTVEG